MRAAISDKYVTYSPVITHRFENRIKKLKNLEDFSASDNLIKASGL